MSENNIYYYEVFLRSNLNNKDYKISLGSLSGSKFKTIDTEFPSSSFLSSVVGGTNNVLNNIDYILDYHKNTYNLSNSALKDFRIILEDGNYYFDVQRIDFSDDAVGDANNNNEPYIIVNNYEISNDIGTVNSDLTNSNNDCYVANFNVRVSNVDSVSDIFVYVHTSSDPLPDPISTSITSIQDLKNYLSIFFTDSDDLLRIDNYLSEALSIYSIEWAGDFWKIDSTSNACENNNQFKITNVYNDDGTVIGQRTKFEFPKCVPLYDSECEDPNEVVSYDIYYSPEGAKAAKDLLAIDINKNFEKYFKKYCKNENANLSLPDVFGKSWAPYLIPALRPTKFNLEGEQTWPDVLNPTPKPPGYISFKTINWEDIGTLPTLRFELNSTGQVTPESLPQTIDITVYLSITMGFSYQKRIYEAWEKFQAALTSTENNQNIAIDKFENKKPKNTFSPYRKEPKSPDFEAAENIVKEEADGKKESIHEGYILEQDSRQENLTSNGFEIPLLIRPKSLRQNRRNPTQWFVEYSIKFEDFFSTIVPQFFSLLRSLLDNDGFIDEFLERELLVDYDSEDNSLGESLTRADKNFISKVISEFRDYLLVKAKKITKDKCAKLLHNDGSITYRYFIVEDSVRLLGPTGKDLFDGNVYNKPEDRPK